MAVRYFHNASDYCSSSFTVRAIQTNQSYLVRYQERVIVMERNHVTDENGHGWSWCPEQSLTEEEKAQLVKVFKAIEKQMNEKESV